MLDIGEKCSVQLNQFFECSNGLISLTILDCGVAAATIQFKSQGRKAALKPYTNISVSVSTNFTYRFTALLPLISGFKSPTEHSPSFTRCAPVSVIVDHRFQLFPILDPLHPVHVEGRNAESSNQVH